MAYNMTKPKSYKDLVNPRRNVIMAKIKEGPISSAELYAALPGIPADTIKNDLVAMAKMGWAHSKRPAAKTAGKWYTGPQPATRKPPAQVKTTHPNLYAMLCFGRAPKLPEIKGRVVKERAVEATGYRPIATRFVSSLEFV